LFCLAFEPAYLFISIHNSLSLTIHGFAGIRTHPKAESLTCDECIKRKFLSQVDAGIRVLEPAVR